MASLPTDVLIDFGALLRRRIENRVHTNEDSIRYTFFASLLRHGFQPEEVVLEYPHPGVPGGEIDTVLMHEEHPSCAIEFKYHRAGKRNSPTTQKAGDLFRDLARLVLFDAAVGRYFVYVTDPEMAAYKMLRQFFELSVGDQLALDASCFAGLRATFTRRMGAWPSAATLQLLIAERMPNEHQLRVYEVARPESRAREHSEQAGQSLA